MQEINYLYLALSIITGITGIYLGWLARGGILELSEEKVQLIISLVITIIWASSIVASILSPTYAVAPATHVIMGLVAAYFFKKDVLNIQLGNEK